MKKRQRKRVISFVLSLSLMFTLAACGNPVQQSNDTTEETNAAPETTSVVSAAESNAPQTKDRWKLGFSIFDLSVAVFAELAQELETYGSQLGFDVTVADCQNDPSKQLDQIENFIVAGMDCIILSALDADAVKPLLAECKQKGIYTISFGFDQEGVDSILMANNYDVGKLIGKSAADWINANPSYSDMDTVEVALLNIPEYAEHVKRENGITDALAEDCPKANIVARVSAFNVSEGMNAMENILQAHPNVKVVVANSDGSALGAYQVMLQKNLTSGEYGIFACDATMEAVEAIKGDTIYRMTINLGGGGKEMGDNLADMSYALVSGQKLDPVVYQSMTVVDYSNVEEYIKSVQ